MDRQPCPYRIFDDVGNGFLMGVVAGTAWNMFKGAKNAPKGERFRGGIRTVRQRAPILGGNFAVFSGLFSGFDCLIAKARQKEDLVNPLMAGFASGALLAFRGGTGPMIRGGMIAGTLIFFMEVIAMKMQNASLKSQMQTDENLLPPPTTAPPRHIFVNNPEYRSKEFDILPPSTDEDLNIFDSNLPRRTSQQSRQQPSMQQSYNNFALVLAQARAGSSPPPLPIEGMTSDLPGLSSTKVALH